MVVFDRGKHHAFVLDAQVTGTRVPMSERFAQKVRLYKTAAVQDWLASRWNCTTEQTTTAGIILNNRGAILNMSWDSLKRLRIPRRLLEFLSFRVLVDSWYMWNFWSQTS